MRFWLLALLMLARAVPGYAGTAEDDQVAAAYRKVFEQLKQGVPVDKAMQSAAQAVDAQTEADRRDQEAAAEERRKNGPPSATLDSSPKAVEDAKPILDPKTIPKEITYEQKGASKRKKALTPTPSESEIEISGSRSSPPTKSGVDELEYPSAPGTKKHEGTRSE